MKKFFIPLYELPIDWKFNLQQNNVKWASFNYWYGKGILVDEANLKTLLNVFNFRVQEQLMTSNKNIFRLNLNNCTSKINAVYVSGWRSPFKSDKFVSITKEILLPFVKKDIIISGPHNWPIQLLDDGCFHVLFWSSQVGWSQKLVPKEIWGIPSTCPSRAMLPSNKGYQIKDFQANYVVAEVTNSSIYIFHDICYKGVNSELTLYNKILENSITVFNDMTLNPAC